MVAEVNALIEKARLSLDVLADESRTRGGRRALSRQLLRTEGPDWHLIPPIVHACARQIGRDDAEDIVTRLHGRWTRARADRTGPPPPPGPGAGTSGPNPPWLRRHRLLVGLAVLALVAAGGTALAVIDDPDPSRSQCAPAAPAEPHGDECASTSDPDPTSPCDAASQAELKSGECVGISDGHLAFPLGEQGEGVFERIARENDRVDRSNAPVATVAYLMSLPYPVDPTRTDGLRHQLQGAHLAQLVANRSAGPGDPLIRLVIANNGTEANGWQPVADRLIELGSDPGRPLLAVAGLGESRDNTLRAIDRLDGEQVPMVSATLSADDLGWSERDNRPAPGQRVDSLVRVGPTNSQEAAALTGYLATTRIRRPLLIEDTNPSDTYAQTLSKAFRDRFTRIALPAERYNAALPLGGVFPAMLANLCQRRPDVVYFAGRGTQLLDFIEALPQRPCPQQKISIVSGDSTTGLINLLIADDMPESRPLRAGLASGVTVHYTAMAHPDAWRDRDAGQRTLLPAATTPFTCADPHDACLPVLFPRERLDDGQAIMAHDAVLTAVTAIGQTDAGLDPRTRRQAVIQQWNLLHRMRAVPGASGWISLDGRGVPEDKAIEIMKINEKGGLELAKVTTPDGGAPFVPIP